ncbi:hypothetical protein MSG28_014167 [Choristoneura fumiferana]|uniref:Uncharacterized protein n=1 Tax=Choristoneura fumiferana TaxID=7141 RepID=A0ACC0JG74_CHOFU|nr:hypothetical protein MSG28_014167 [Choristoneura fumiferana]
MPKGAIEPTSDLDKGELRHQICYVVSEATRRERIPSLADRIMKDEANRLVRVNLEMYKVAGSARIATTILLANPAMKQHCLHCCVSAWRCYFFKLRINIETLQVVGPCARSAWIATTILLANPAMKQQCLHCCVSAWRVRQPVKLLALEAITSTYECRKKSTTGSEKPLLRRIRRHQNRWFLELVVIETTTQASILPNVQEIVQASVQESMQASKHKLVNSAQLSPLSVEVSSWTKNIDFSLQPQSGSAGLWFAMGIGQLVQSRKLNHVPGEIDYEKAPHAPAPARAWPRRVIQFPRLYHAKAFLVLL